MKVINLPIGQLSEAPWNPNVMDSSMTARLRESICRYGLVENLVVRPDGENVFEVLSGNQRLRILREMNPPSIPCVVVNVDDANARLLAQALNQHGEDDLGLRAEAVRKILETIPEADVLAILPGNAAGLKGLALMGQETVAEYLQAWQKAQAARLKHFQFQVTDTQKEVIEEALERMRPGATAGKGDSPNVRGTALYLLCKFYLEKAGLP